MTMTEYAMTDEGAATNKGRDATVLFPARVLLTCHGCKTNTPRRFPCDPNITFSWANNPCMQLQKPINQEPFTLYDDEGGQHFLKFTKVDLRNSECLRVWRTQFLASLMGARDLPQRCIHHESLASDALHFAWRDNLHLLRDDFRYLIASPGNPAWDIKTLTLIDITGAAHTLSFGKSAVLHTRVEKWRTQTINNTIKSFQRVFGNPPSVDSSHAEILQLQKVLGTYVHNHGHRNLSLDDHLRRVQMLALPELTSAGMRLEMNGPNFPDYLRSAITRSDTLQKLIAPLRWEGRVRQTNSRTSKVVFLRRLVADYSAACDKSKNLATHVYNLWKLYENAFFDHTLPSFRKRLLRDHSIVQLLKPFSRPQDMRYRYGDLAKDSTDTYSLP